VIINAKKISIFNLFKSQDKNLKRIILVQ